MKEYSLCAELCKKIAPKLMKPAWIGVTLQAPNSGKVGKSVEIWMGQNIRSESSWGVQIKVWIQTLRFRPNGLKWNTDSWPQSFEIIQIWTLPLWYICMMGGTRALYTTYLNFGEVCIHIWIWIWTFWLRTISSFKGSLADLFLGIEITWNTQLEITYRGSPCHTWRSKETFIVLHPKALPFHMTVQP